MSVHKLWHMNYILAKHDDDTEFTEAEYDHFWDKLVDLVESLGMGFYGGHHSMPADREDCKCGYEDCLHCECDTCGDLECPHCKCMREQTSIWRSDMNKAIGTVAIWLGPALACWATENPWVALAFVASLFATLATSSAG